MKTNKRQRNTAFNNIYPKVAVQWLNLKFKILIISMFLVIFGLVNGEEKEYYDSVGNITKNINSAFE